ncbi:MAG: hypothetical protein ACMVY4_02035 [Minwuia sp.]|uniref:hypothetical protein n=1 Tax=Minwuia sp. TaxID=2493630 RepID=UPI003A88D619
MTPNITAQERISGAIRDWIQKLQEYPGWREWKRSQIVYTLYFDDEFIPLEKNSEEFKFSPEIEMEHAVVTSYMELLSTVNALRDVEWYFRRYPFSRAPVSRESHLRYCCEMYFGRFYQFRERLKNLSKAVNSANSDHGLDFGKFIKIFDKEFDQEIRARHGVHHREAFDEVAISRIALLELTDTSDDRELRKRDYQSHYRKSANEWASRTRHRSHTLDKFVEAVADALLSACPFLNVARD